MDIDAWMQRWMNERKNLGENPPLEFYLQEYDRLLDEIINAKWSVGFSDRGMGHGDYGVIADVSGETILIVKGNKEIVEHIVFAHNKSYLP